jgi:hypothetical protein
LGTSSYTNAQPGQTVFMYNFNDAQSDQITDLPVLNSFCMFTGVSSTGAPEPLQVSIDAVDETGTWGVYVHAGPSGQSGAGTAQIACIVNNGP